MTVPGSGRDVQVGGVGNLCRFVITVIHVPAALILLFVASFNRFVQRLNLALSCLKIALKSRLPLF